MHVLAFIIAVLAAFIFGVEAWQTQPRRLTVALGLFVLTIAWIVYATYGGDPHDNVIRWGG